MIEELVSFRTAEDRDKYYYGLLKPVRLFTKEDYKEMYKRLQEQGDKIMYPVELVFVHHCDPPCGLGFVQFECPWCREYSRDYSELWYHFSGEDEVKETAEGSCEFCKRKLLFKDIKGKYLVKEIK